MREIRIHKVMLGPFIDMLVNAYGEGADYIDLVVQKGEYNQDGLGIIVLEEYMNFERYEQHMASKPVHKNIKMKRLTKNHFNKLNNSIN